MALQEHDREDLLRDGRTMPWRGECVIEGITVVTGFRRQGQLSLYCGPDPVFQFNAERKLRRLFIEGRRLAAHQGELVELVRESRGGRVEFKTIQVDVAMQDRIDHSLRNWLERIRGAADDETANWRVVEAEGPTFHERLSRWLRQSPQTPEIADSPQA